jgi:hypothetical protein
LTCSCAATTRVSNANASTRNTLRRLQNGANTFGGTNTFSTSPNHADADDSKRAQVLRAVAENAALSRAEFNRAFVLMQFFGYLRRDPDAALDVGHTGYDFWPRKLDQFGGDFIRAEMVKAFLNSDEYRKRFGR